MLALARSARKPAARPPDAEERLLDGVLGEPVVAEDPEGEAVGDPADAVVQLGQRALVAAGDECDESLVREMSEVPAHGPGTPKRRATLARSERRESSRMASFGGLDRFGFHAGSNRLRGSCEPAPIRDPTQGRVQ